MTYLREARGAISRSGEGARRAQTGPGKHRGQAVPSAVADVAGRLTRVSGSQCLVLRESLIAEVMIPSIQNVPSEIQSTDSHWPLAPINVSSIGSRAGVHLLSTYLSLRSRADLN